MKLDYNQKQVIEEMREENQSYQDKMMGTEKELNVVDYTQDNSNNTYENQSIFYL